MENYTEVITEFAKDVEEGLSAKEKFLSSKYFYDDEGSRLFREIMNMPEYYLSGAELEVFQLNKKRIAQDFSTDNCIFDIIELGAGDGSKTKVLLKYLTTNRYQIKYIPIDISAEAIVSLEANISEEIPDLDIESKIGDYFTMLEEIRLYDNNPKILLFLGSNIGNFSPERSIQFLSKVRMTMSPFDKLFIGFDLKKDPEVILNAYNDSTGFTRDFNLNLLNRINRELGANFETGNFIHYPIYDPALASAKSFLVSTCDQEVTIRALDKTFQFKKWEAIDMERSQKYDAQLIRKLAKESGFKVTGNYFDSRNYFVNSLWSPIEID